MFIGFRCSYDSTLKIKQYFILLMFIKQIICLPPSKLLTSKSTSSFVSAVLRIN